MRTELRHIGGNCFDLLLVAEQDDALFDFSEPLTFEGIEGIVHDKKGDVDVIIEGWTLTGPGDPCLTGDPSASLGQVVRGAVVVEVSVTHEGDQDTNDIRNLKARFNVNTVERGPIEVEALALDASRVEDVVKRMGLTPISIEEIPTETPDTAPIETTSLFWDCECDDDFIHSIHTWQCRRCYATQDEQPDSRLDEVAARLLDGALKPWDIVAFGASVEAERIGLAVLTAEATYPVISMVDDRVACAGAWKMPKTVSEYLYWIDDEVAIQFEQAADHPEEDRMPYARFLNALAGTLRALGFTPKRPANLISAGDDDRECFDFQLSLPITVSVQARDAAHLKQIHADPSTGSGQALLAALSNIRTAINDGVIDAIDSELGEHLSDSALGDLQIVGRPVVV